MTANNSDCELALVCDSYTSCLKLPFTTNTTGHKPLELSL